MTATMKVFPVIRVLDRARLIRDIGSAEQAGVNGVFLVGAAGHERVVVHGIRTARGVYPDQFIGVRLGGHDLAATLRVLRRAFHGATPVDAVWSDVDETTGTSPAGSADVLHFGGLAAPPDRTGIDGIRALGIRARGVCDVPTVSLAEFGPQRLRALRTGLDDRPLAVSGAMTPAGIVGLASVADHALVTAGVRDARGELDSETLRALVTASAGSPPLPPGVRRGIA